MTQQLTPLTINIMLACYDNDFHPIAVIGEARWHCVAGSAARRWLLDNGLIDDANRATEHGKFWVEQGILQTPLPAMRRFIPPRQSTLEEDSDVKEAAE